MTLYLIFLLAISLTFAVEKWGQFELTLKGPSDGNPFVDYTLFADFTLQNSAFHVRGFYDGNGIYKIRFMPDQVGEWSYITSSNVETMDKLKGKFNVSKPMSTNNRGPVVVNKNNNKSFIYLETGESFFQTGTTSYAWIHEKTYNNTIDTIKYISSNGIFNKIRFTIFPKWYDYTHDEPAYYPYSGTPPNQWGNFDRFNIDYWHHLDYCLQSISDYDIIADIILFHPYDQGHWGFDCMGCVYPNNTHTCREDTDNYNISNDLFYLQYAIARIASYRNVWYSIANEWDHVSCKQKGMINQTNGNNPKDTYPIWDEYFKTIMKEDPYGNMYKEKSIHNGNLVYNYSQPWTTHFSVQSFSNTPYNWWQTHFNVNKPVVYDEEGYEGNISDTFGLHPGVFEVDRFWMGNAHGNMVGHSECMLPNSTDNKAGTSIMWWNLGNTLRGYSYEKIQWFGEYMRNTSMHPPFEMMDSYCYDIAYEMYHGLNVSKCDISQLYKKGEFYLIYFANSSESTKISVDVGNSDTYAMSYIDYNGTKIEFMGNVSGPKIDITANAKPYNLQLVNVS